MKKSLLVTILVICMLMMTIGTTPILTVSAEVEDESDLPALTESDESGDEPDLPSPTENTELEDDSDVPMSILSLGLEGGPDAPTEKVIFIKDGGTGDGSSAEQAFGGDSSQGTANDHKTALYQAALKLIENGGTGGTIVICGEVKIGANQSYGTGANNRDFRFPEHGTNIIKITSSYGGVDYRETNNAKLIVEHPANIELNGQTIWENIEICTSDSLTAQGTDRAICCNNYPTIFGSGIVCTTYDGKLPTTGNKAYFIGIAGSNRYANSSGKTTNITIMSGTYNFIVGGNAQIPSSIFGGDTNITIAGDTVVLGNVIGGSNLGQTSGNVNITIEGGTFYGSISGTNTKGFNNSDAISRIKINGGDFTRCTGIYGGSNGNLETGKNQPYCSIIDFSSYDPEQFEGVKDFLSSKYEFESDSYTQNFNTVILPGEDPGIIPDGSDVKALIIQPNKPSDVTTKIRGIIYSKVNIEQITIEAKDKNTGNTKFTVTKAPDNPKIHNLANFDNEVQEKFIESGVGNYVYTVTVKLVGGEEISLCEFDLKIGYSVTYHGNGNTSGTVPVDENLYAEGATVNVLGNTGNLAIEGYAFNGWNTNASGSGITYMGNDTFTMGNSDVVLYANWRSNVLPIVTPVPTVTTTPKEKEPTKPTTPKEPTKRVIIIKKPKVPTSSKEPTKPTTTTEPAKSTILPEPKAPEVADNVIFVKDGGTGDGSSPDKALGAKIVLPYDDSKAERYYQNSVLYQAADKLKDTGGTIVIIGEVKIGKEESYGSGSKNRDFIFPNNGLNTIKFTSKYNGIDYRETNGAKLIVEHPAQIIMGGQSVWENIEISTKGDNRVIACQNYATFFGEGIECTNVDGIPDTSKNAQFFIGIAGSNRYAAVTKESTTNITVLSGTYNKIVGSLWGLVSFEPLYLFKGETNITIGGSTKVLGNVCGSGNEVNTYHEGNANITILGGTFYGKIEGTNKIGFNNSDAHVNITIAGGDFSGCIGIYGGNSELVKYNQPYSSTLDFSYYPPKEYKEISPFLSILYKVTKDNNTGNFNKVILPKGDILYKVTYNLNGGTGGSVPVDSNSYKEGDTVKVLGEKVTFKKDGFTFGGWNTKADGSGNNYKYGDTFKMGDDDITLYAKWVPAGSTFSDVSKDAWYSEAIEYMASKGIINAVNGDKFEPEANITRADFLIMVMKSYGIEPYSTVSNNFSDAGNKYYTNYLGTAKELGLVGGVGNNLFLPEENLSREDLFVMYYRVLEKTKNLPQGKSNKKLSDFSDSANISSYAVDALKALVEAGVIQGSGDKLNPKGIATRAEAVQILYNNLKDVKK